jgi:hypothetical protein
MLSQLSFPARFAPATLRGRALRDPPEKVAAGHEKVRYVAQCF